MTFGSICLNRSTTLSTPKSGEVLDQMAPIELTAKNEIVASGTFGRKATTRSPFATPRFF